MFGGGAVRGKIEKQGATWVGARLGKHNAVGRVRGGCGQAVEASSLAASAKKGDGGGGSLIRREAAGSASAYGEGKGTSEVAPALMHAFTWRLITGRVRRPEGRRAEAGG